ncbi:hypothetical protein BpHYR1_002968 [Brachionus plicatilis]|uniref:Uncharacterized protein n=1 Tax=Brachionus plicatilis TaxID=10195 RepID=A0A3M7PNC5_BRAPC|nr:hypothetical protein BpHYR1_002968 [Brachionus plicatilis]
MRIELSTKGANKICGVLESRIIYISRCLCLFLHGDNSIWKVCAGRSARVHAQGAPVLDEE